jgi:hypothetical protein
MTAWRSRTRDLERLILFSVGMRGTFLVSQWDGRSRILFRLRGGILVLEEHIPRYVGFWNRCDGQLRVRTESALSSVVESIARLM